MRIHDRSTGNRIVVHGLLIWIVTVACAPPATDLSTPPPMFTSDTLAAPRPDVGQLAGLDPTVVETPTPRVDGIGLWPSHAQSGHAEAIAFLDQGRAYLASFEWLLAARSFHAALRQDPSLALAEIGLARAFLGLESRPRAQVHAARAAALPAPAAEPDRAHLALGLEQLAAVAAWDRGDHAPHAAYRAALEAHAARHPEDVHVAILRGHAEARPDGWGQLPRPQALRWYRQALDHAPDHAGAHHFLAHMLEGLGRHAEALPHAERFAALAPAIPHAHHMVGHLLPHAGRWREAKVALVDADRRHRARIAALSLSMAEDWHYGHNLRLLGAIHQHLGEVEEAADAYNAAAAIGYGGRRAGFYCLPRALFLLGEGRATDALDAAKSCAELPDPLARVLGTAVAGQARVALGQPEPAARDLERARIHQHALEADRRPDVNEGSFVHMGRMAIAMLEAMLTASATVAAEGDPRLIMATQVCRGPSVDAWASCRLWTGILARDAERRGPPGRATAIRRLAVR